MQDVFIIMIIDAIYCNSSEEQVTRSMFTIERFSHIVGKILVQNLWLIFYAVVKSSKRQNPLLIEQ